MDAPPPLNGYPEGWVLDRWPAGSILDTPYYSPIDQETYVLAEVALRFPIGLYGVPLSLPTVSAKSAVRDALNRFPFLLPARFIAHKNYYNLYSNPLGVKIWQPAPTVNVEGVDYRYVSNFLFYLNGGNDGTIPPMSDASGANEYAVAGDSSVFYGVLYGPYRIPSDGVVPTESAFGIDPLTQTSLIANIVNSDGTVRPYSYNHVLVPLNHDAYYTDSSVINKYIIPWLLIDE